MKAYKFTYKLERHQSENFGGYVERNLVYWLTGVEYAMSNTSCYITGDYLTIQIKSGHTTICNGTNLESHLNRDRAQAYLFATKNGKVYLMSKQEYKAFVESFMYIDHDGKGREKLRLRQESRAMAMWLESHVA